jgi:hypothetical protein
MDRSAYDAEAKCATPPQQSNSVAIQAGDFCISDRGTLENICKRRRIHEFGHGIAGLEQHAAEATNGFL